MRDMRCAALQTIGTRRCDHVSENTTTCMSVGSGELTSEHINKPKRLLFRAELDPGDPLRLSI
jgi:hypothetical protein